MHALINTFLQDESGAPMIEYGLLVALIALVVGAAAVIVGTQLSKIFSEVGEYLTNTTVPTGGP